MSIELQDKDQKSDFKETAKALPSYLKDFVVEQNYEAYTPRDHAVWRFIMRQGKGFFKLKAHPIYIDGFAKTGIPTSRIPNIKEMDATLRKFSWRAVCVKGFIPPQIFLEFFAHKILPIAADMRSIEHIAYTPAPDIVHEAAGHAPILADPAYASFLERFGKIASKAIYSDEDIKLYEAIRILSDVKERPEATKEEIQESEETLTQTVASISWTSEASKLSRMFWWTAEYGLIGSKENPQIYGAGILSSLGESHSCLSSQVKKIPFGLACTEASYDITKPQPQLFVAEDFKHLGKVLEDFTETLSYKKGGQEALKLAKKANSVTTVAFDTGFEVTGILKNFTELGSSKNLFLEWKKPIQISYKGKALGSEKDSEISEFSLFVGKEAASRESQEQKEKREAFKMSLPLEIFSVYGGAADRENFKFSEQAVSLSSPARSTPFSREELELFSLYSKAREFRDSFEDGFLEKEKLEENLKKIVDLFFEKHPEEWLLGVEIVELAYFLKTPKEGLGKALEETLINLKKHLLDAKNLTQSDAKFSRDGLDIANVLDNDPLRKKLFFS